jgi:hypothetical protein
MLMSISSLLSAFLRFDGDMDMDEEYVQQRFRYHKRMDPQNDTPDKCGNVFLRSCRPDNLPSTVSCTTSMEC